MNRPSEWVESSLWSVRWGLGGKQEQAALEGPLTGSPDVACRF